MNVQFIRSGDGTINLFVNGNVFTISAEMPTYFAVNAAIQSGDISEARMCQLLNIQTVVAETARAVSQGKVEVDLAAGKVWYDGVLFPDAALCQRILNLMAEGQPFQYMVNFLEKLAKNPDLRCVMATFGFIKAKGFPITPEGNILAYKGIDGEWKDCYTHTVDNHVGAVNKMPREKCDPNRKVDCSVGFHVGTHEYAKSWAQGHVVLVEIDPKDVISIPDSNLTWKMRVCEYRVIADHTNQGILQGQVYDSTGKQVTVESAIAAFDNDTAAHWDNCEGRTYGNNEAFHQDRPEDDDDEDDYEDPLEEDEFCDECGELVVNCVCEDIEDEEDEDFDDEDL